MNNSELFQQLICFTVTAVALIWRCTDEISGLHLIKKRTKTGKVRERLMIAREDTADVQQIFPSGVGGDQKRR